MEARTTCTISITTPASYKGLVMAFTAVMATYGVRLQSKIKIQKNSKHNVKNMPNRAPIKDRQRGVICTFSAAHTPPVRALKICNTHSDLSQPTVHYPGGTNSIHSSYLPSTSNSLTHPQDCPFQ